jgi:phosphoribosylglycinamide formyltransferase 2
VGELGLPAVIKPIMSSSGKGQSVLRSLEDLDTAWRYAQEGGRAGAARCIVEGFVDFDVELTVLTVSAVDGIQCCAPIGHVQIDGDYRESWQPAPISERLWARATEVATTVVEGLGGHGIFGVELFCAGDEVIFSEVSPRPHDTGLVTLISQDLSEFALHVRAILDLPVPNIRLHGPSASCAVLVEGESSQVRFSGLDQVLAEPDTQLRLFGKPNVSGQRRMAVTLARDTTVEAARAKAVRAAQAMQISL